MRAGLGQEGARVYHTCSWFLLVHLSKKERDGVVGPSARRVQIWESTAYMIAVVWGSVAALEALWGPSGSGTSVCPSCV